MVRPIPSKVESASVFASSCIPRKRRDFSMHRSSASRFSRKRPMDAQVCSSTRSPKLFSASNLSSPSSYIDINRVRWHAKNGERAVLRDAEADPGKEAKSASLRLIFRRDSEPSSRSCLFFAVPSLWSDGAPSWSAAASCSGETITSSVPLGGTSGTKNRCRPKAKHPAADEVEFFHNVEGSRATMPGYDGSRTTAYEPATVAASSGK
eukprot:CAMPEP_0183295774 /NCGR_PEP_ID=MMETSP0160_2-20130417/3607_1 /TAXON_ID=2839 ORGANISM="Odontella Sinensis, Strain Grunow 1884" /NCGR_SAMPLE_ID=MMETSP0160_2 /ASSEMBLY_ACC=CAM_ASM_000250 /LENGTH=207 /DNA_ID=CAMNT_0025457307 /DNA_START=589 /DNA_END=1212 /DNA_ORIENTATION=-